MTFFRAIPLATIAFTAAIFFAACGWSGFDPKNRELVECWPHCGPDAEVNVDSGVADTGMEMPPDLGADAGMETPDLGVDAGGEHPDLGEPHDPDAGVPDGGLDLQPLSAELATPNTLTFFWNADPVPADTEGYVLRYSTNAATVQAGGGTVWDAEDDGNLAFKISPHGPGMVHRTTVLGLNADTEYTARLYTKNRVQGEHPFAEGSGRTLPIGLDSMSIFAEEIVGETRLDGFNDPALSALAHDGTHALWFEAGEVELSTALDALGLATPSVGEVRFQSAYLEMFIYVQFAGVPEPTYFLGTELGGSSGSTFTYSYTALPSRLGWTQIQLAVAGFESDAHQPLNAGNLGDHLLRFGISGLWPQGATVFIDDVALRY